MNEELGILPLIVPLLRYRRLLVSASTLGAAVVGAFVYSQPRTYTSSGAFVAVTRSSQGSISSIASQFGLSLPGGEASTSPQFYADLMTQRSVLTPVAERLYSIRTGNDSEMGTLATLFGIKAKVPEERLEATLTKLRSAVIVDVSARTAVVSFNVRTRNRQLSAEVAAELLKQLDAFNQGTMQSRAAAEHRFTESRLEEVSADLRAAEQKVQEFLQRNRGDFRTAPALQFEYERIQRELTLRQQIFSALAQAVEQSRIEEVRDTPVLTILDIPQAAAYPDPRGTVSKSLTAFVLIGFLGAVWVIVRELAILAPAARLHEEYAQLWDETAHDLLSPARWVRQLFGRPRVQGNGV